ncbi:MAG: PE domain-containing protein [Mycobacterium sp.]
MSFLKTIPQELLSAAAQLEGIGTSLTAQNAGAAAPTTSIAPAAADPVSILQSGIFSSYGTLYQQLAAEAQAIQQQFTSTLGLSSGTYSATEAANATTAQATGPVSSLITAISQLLGGPVTSVGGQPFSLSGNFANFLNFETGNWASAMSDVLGVAGGGLLPAAGADVADAGAVDAVDAVSPAAGVGGMGGMGALGMMPAGGLGQATMVGSLSAPPSWAGSVTPGAGLPAATPLETVGWTAAPPQAAPGTFVPGVPGLASAARNSAGFGAPRYGVKPIVMPKVTAV